MAGSISSAPWNGDASRFTPEQWAASCIVDRGPGVKGKARYSLPVKEPSGAYNRNGIAAAAGRVGQLEPPSLRGPAARALARLYRSVLGTPVPPEVAALAK